MRAPFGIEVEQDLAGVVRVGVELELSLDVAGVVDDGDHTAKDTVYQDVVVAERNVLDLHLEVVVTVVADAEARPASPSGSTPVEGTGNSSSLSVQLLPPVRRSRP